MPLTQDQINQLNIASQRIAQGQGTETDIRNVNYAKQQYGYGGGQPVVQQPQTYQDFINQAFSDPEYNQDKKQLEELMKKQPTYLDEKIKEFKLSDTKLQDLYRVQGDIRGKLYGAPADIEATIAEYDTVFDPATRRQLIGQAVGNLLSQLSTTEANIDVRGGKAEQLATTAYNTYAAEVNTLSARLEAKEKMLQAIADTNYTEAQNQLQRIQDLEDYEKKAIIDRKYSTTTPPGINPVTTIDDFLKLGYKRDVTAEGGYNFYDPQGNPVDVLSASMDSGVPLATLLNNSAAPADVEFLADLNDGLVTQESLLKLGGVSQNFGGGGGNNDLSGLSDDDLLNMFNELLNEN